MTHTKTFNGLELELELSIHNGLLIVSCRYELTNELYCRQYLLGGEDFTELDACLNFVEYYKKETSRIIHACL